MKIFDDMIDDLRNGDTLIASYDTGLKISINYEALTLEDDDVELTISSEEVLQLLRAWLEIYITAREEPLNINYDDLLTGF